MVLGRPVISFRATHEEGTHLVSLGYKRASCTSSITLMAEALNLVERPIAACARDATKLDHVMKQPRVL